MNLINVLFLCLFLCGGIAPAAEFMPPMPQDLDQAKFSLLTVGLGEPLFARYGHSMIRVADPSNQLDYMVNWGLFDFSDPWFVPKFFRGILIYRMGFSPSLGTIRYYKDVEKRSITEDDISLTKGQKRLLMESIIRNAQPENIKYPYQYFRNNCATIPRDILDKISSGSIRRKFEGEMSTLSFRDYVRANLSINPFVAWGLDIIFNGDSDHKLTKWEEMFYPPKLRDYLAQMPSFDDFGHEIPNGRLLTNNRKLVDLPEPNPKAIDGYLLTWAVAGIPLLIIAGSRLHRHLTRLKEGTFWHARLFGLVSVWWGLTSGFFGLTHFSGWLFSSHTDLHRNINMLIFWPFDMLVLILAVQWGFLGRKTPFDGVLKIRFWRWLAIGHIAFLPLHVLLALSGIFIQDATRVALYMSPLSCLYYFMLIRICDDFEPFNTQKEVSPLCATDHPN